MNQVIKKTIDGIDFLTEKVSGLAGALGASQFPNFYNYYKHDVLARVDELKEPVMRLTKEAERLDYSSVNSYVRHLEHVLNTTSDYEYIETSVRESINIVDRFSFLSSSYEQLSQANPISKLYAFISSYDSQIFKNTMDAFEASVPISVEATCYAVAGFIGATLAYKFVKKGIKTVAKES